MARCNCGSGSSGGGSGGCSCVVGAGSASVTVGGVGTADDPYLISVVETYGGDVVVARLVEAIMVDTITRDIDGAPLSSDVLWPDGTAGTYTADVVSTAFPGSVDAYHVTYEPVGDPVKTFTQPSVTRNVGGQIIDLPAIVVT